MIQVHVTPDNDFIAHTLSGNCPCTPRFGVDNEIVNENFFIHIAQDERPVFIDVWDTEVLVGKAWTISSRLV